MISLSVADSRVAEWTNYCIVAASELLVYEYVITIGQEYHLIWKRPRTGNSVIFLLNRLNMLCMCISLILFTNNWHNIVASPQSESTHSAQNWYM
ncbi:hypothetical protein C8Q72DRAFT_849108 [Fomitopsis betulina]|nr:hypothetical protein C8Q72DRAFT_849108 [Fomitopsis betulina]